MSDQTLELTPEKLNVAVVTGRSLDMCVFEAINWKIIETRTKGAGNINWQLRDRDDKLVKRLTASLREADAHALLVPNFSTSIDACKPLIEEMQKFGQFMIRIDFDKTQIEFYLKKQGDPLRTIACLEHECDAEIDLIQAQAICYCNIFLQFKELTTKEETNG